MTMSPASAATGTATIVRPANDIAAPGNPLQHGTPTTPFSFALPKGAACTKSSAEAGYRVRSFMVPSSTDPIAIDDDTMPLFTVTGDPYVDAQTAQGQRGEPGYIVNLPAFNLALLSEKDAPAGSYAVGVACTKGDEVDHVWSAALTLAGDRSWTAATAGSSTSATTLVVAPSAAQPTPSVESSSEPPVVIVTRNALPVVPGGNPSVNVSALALPRWLAFALVLIVLRVAFLFRPRPLVMES